MTHRICTERLEGSPRGYRSSTRLPGDRRNPDAPEYLISRAEYEEIVARKAAGLGQWEKPYRR